MSGRGPGVALALPRTADGRPILWRADLEAYDPRFVCSGGRERFYCPVHGSDHQRSLSLDPQTGQFVCHTCKARGTLRDFWPDQTPGKIREARKTRARSLEEIGRASLAARRRADAERGERMAADLSAEAAAFLARLGTMQRALRAPDSPGALYLRRRGLDPEVAARLGAGYAAPNAWPGDRSRKVGRIVYPLADAITGRLVSALGRLCMDADPSWSAEMRGRFDTVKQRKLAGCPAGIWPRITIAAARATGQPVVLVEGPADVVALTQRSAMPMHVVALLGTASNLMPAAALQGLPGVVLALDNDEAGRSGTLALWTDLVIAGIHVEMPGEGWLGTASDIAELAKQALTSDEADEQYGRAVVAVQAACDRLIRSSCPSISLPP